MYILNTTKIGKKTYTDADITHIYPPKTYGFAEDFYGGRVKWVSPVKNSALLLLIEYKNDIQNVIDLAITDVSELPLPTLQSIASKQRLLKGFKDDETMTREELLKLLTA